MRRQLPALPEAPQTWLNAPVSRSKWGCVFEAHQSHVATVVPQPLPQHMGKAPGTGPTHAQLGCMSGAFTQGPHSW